MFNVPKDKDGTRKDQKIVISIRGADLEVGAYIDGLYRWVTQKSKRQ